MSYIKDIRSLVKYSTYLKTNNVDSKHYTKTGVVCLRSIIESMEYVVFVNPDGTPTGEIGPKLESHTGDTRLHLAFSCYVFNDDGKLLVTRRADHKKVWPSVWTNSVCGHPAPGEEIEAAIVRRLDNELGMTAHDFKIILPSLFCKIKRYTTAQFG